MFNIFRKKFNADLLKEKKGTISGMFFSNPHVGIETTLFLQIQIELEPFTYNEEVQNTSIALDFIKIPFTSYVELEGNSFKFPVNPTEGYIDGSIYISGMHNPFDVTEIVFGKANSGSIEASFKGKLSFEDGSIKTTVVNVNSVLEFSNILIHCDKLLELPEESLVEYIEDNLNTNYFESAVKDKYILIKR